MKKNFTASQEKAIEERGQSILVSAAAGSGKTTVLVERIIRSLLREKDPLDIDRILVMTFTKAAAGEMRDRITKEINSSLKTSGNKRLYAQAALVHNAHISTIHGFCLDVIRNHFHRIDLSPDFRPMDEAERKLLMADVLGEVLEEAYESNDAAFLAMSEKIAAGKSDSALEEVILKLYGFAVSNADIENWFDTCEKIYADFDEQSFDDNPLVVLQLQHYQDLLRDLLKHGERALELAMLPGGPYMYADAITDDIEMLKALIHAATYEEFINILPTYSPMRLKAAPKNGPEVDVQMKDMTKSLRDEIKQFLQKMQDGMFVPVKESIMLMRGCEEDVHTLIALTRRFHECFAQAKRQRGLIDFNDMEHFCLRILTENPDIADEYRAFFQEIFVDEYQDTNFVQEAIVNAIADNNVFNVGDVKQSIYRFRMARPDLFLKKYNLYKEGKGGMCIDLQENFRSRIEVILAVNEVFEKIMCENPCHMVYDEQAALKYGADHYDKAPVIENGKKSPGEEDPGTQSVLKTAVTSADYENVTGDDSGTGSVDFSGQNPYVAEYIGIVKEEGVDSKELEAAYIAGRIRELIASGLPVYDKHLQALRPIRYSDIVILLRTVSGWDQKFCSVIEGFGIPVHTESSTGYFTANEIVWLLSYLQVIDNPLQDIPLAAALLSPIGKFSESELALIRSGDKKQTLYRSLCDFAAKTTEPDNTDVIEKTNRFLSSLHAYREKAVTTSVYEILQEIIDGDFGREILSAKGGIKRMANLNMLLDKALEFEKSSYRGLFRFVRYIEYLKKYEIDYGEASLIGEHDNTVRLMSIHKSKGLEFPVVFVSGLHKGMNVQDASSAIVMDADLGIGMSYVDLNRRIKSRTLAKDVISNKIITEARAEEIRTLYVAMTRAREKLIMTGIIAKEENPFGKSSPLPLADSYQQFLSCAADENGNFKHIAVVTVSASDMILPEMRAEIGLEATYRELKNLAVSGKAQGALAEKLHFSYPVDANDSYGKISVTELKKRSMQQTDPEGVEDAKTESFAKDESMPVPSFLAGSEPKILPTMRGTAIHRMLEIWDYSLDENPDTVASFFETVRKQRRMEELLLKAVDVQVILDFLSTDLAGRMKKAALNNRLYREQPFVIDLDGTTLVQGIIDACFIEDERIIVVDYKTDRVDEAQELIDRYAVQLDYYALALERLTGLPVAEKIIYSTKLKKAVPLGTKPEKA